MKLIKIILLCFFVYMAQTIKTQENTLIMRNINIGGLVVDSKTLLPLEGVEIYDKSENLLGSTNVDGYFVIKLNHRENTEIYFSLVIKGAGFETFIQKEHWGNLSGNLKTLFYFGLNSKNNGYEAFSEMISISNKISYDIVSDNFENVKESINFKRKMRKAMENNQDVLIEVDNYFYIVNETGWIKLDSENDLISIDEKEHISALKINSVLERKNIKGMTTTDSNEVAVIIYTK